MLSVPVGSTTSATTASQQQLNRQQAETFSYDTIDRNGNNGPARRNLAQAYTSSRARRTVDARRTGGAR